MGQDRSGPSVPRLRLYRLEGLVARRGPRCELYWPEDRRDRAVEACTAYLKRYGDRFKADPPSERNGFIVNRDAPGVPRAGPARDPC